MKESNRVCRTLDEYPVGISQAGKRLGIEIDARLIGFHDFHNDFTGIRNDNRPVR